MEIMGASNFDEEWDYSLSKMFSNGDHSNPNLVGFYDNNESSFFPTNFFHSVSQESRSSNSSEMEITASTFPIYNGNCENNIYLQPNGVNFLHESNFHVEPVFSDNVMEEILQLKVEPAGSDHFCKEMQLIMKRKYDEGNYSTENPKKKSRIPRNIAEKNKRGNYKKVIQDNNDEEENNGGFNKQRSSSCNSEDDPNASQELNGGESKGSASNGKARASDPQSVYARRRRERINERLRILQNLVPNGAKVDISTMLEEAVQYVKFLQLQIKMLSSDDLWMYAPIAYNGMDLGMYQKISPNDLCLQN